MVAVLALSASTRRVTERGPDLCGPPRNISVKAMGRFLVVLAMCATACVRSNAMTCDDGSVCREGTRCHLVGEMFQCVTPFQEAACEQKAPGAACLEDTGTCFDGACLPSACGNGRLDANEVCDAGDTVAGDGCSATCRSDESCGNSIVDPVRLVNGAIELNEQCDDGNVLTHDGCSSGCRSEVAGWRVVDPAPAIRQGTAMVTDTARRRLVVFGGLNATGGPPRLPSGDTWILVSDGWIRIRSAVSPSARSDHAMAFDGQNTVLFGGWADPLVFDDTWELDRGQWRLVSPATHPAGRWGHAMALMPGVGVVLFGGQTGAATSETWIYKNGNWTDVSATAGRPPARSKAALAYDPVRGRLVLAAGEGTSGRLDDTWVFDGTTWTEIPLSGAPRVSGGMAAFDVTRGRVVLHGGYGSMPGSNAVATQSGSYGWSGTTWEPFVTSFLQRHSGAAATDPITGELCFYGAIFTPVPPCSPCTDSPDGDLNRLSDPNWSSRTYGAYDGAWGATAAFDPDRRLIVATGGAESTPPVSTGTLKTWEGGEQSFQLQSAFGPAMVNAASAYGRFPNSRGVYVFGGRSGGALSAATWQWSNAMWTQVSTATSPPPRQQHAMAFDVKRGVIVVFGGNAAVGTNALLRDTWEFDGTSWTNRTLATGPSARAGHAMAYDPIRQRVLVFGGDVGSTTLDDLWSWDGTAWTELTPAIRPSPRVTPELAWDAPRKALVLYGALDDTWEWNGTAWTPVPLFDVPAPRRDHVLVPSPSGAGVIAFGGLSNGLNTSVLQLVHDEPTAEYAGCHSQFDDDGDGKIGCADPDCWARCTPWCPPGAPCDTTLPRCGDGACDKPREDCGICPDDCGACP